MNRLILCTFAILISTAANAEDILLLCPDSETEAPPIFALIGTREDGEILLALGIEATEDEPPIIGESTCKLEANGGLKCLEVTVEDGRKYNVSVSLSEGVYTAHIGEVGKPAVDLVCESGSDGLR